MAQGWRCRILEYNDGLRPGGRAPRLYLAKDGEVSKFKGDNIPERCAIAASKFEKNGKWSNTTYQLELAPGVRALTFLSPLHGVWGQNFKSWGEVAENLGLAVETARTLVRAEYPQTGKRLDKIEQFAIDCEQQGRSSETVIVSFGSPMKREIAGGFWESPKAGKTSDGRSVILRPSADTSGWTTPEVIEPAGAQIVAVRHTGGYHGGYYYIEVVVPLAS